jgi:2'-5' RNA ligase
VSPESPYNDGKRLFVGARVSVGTANALAGAAETLARRARDAGVDGIKWVAPINYHVTIKFLGWTRDAALGALHDALGAAASGLAPPRLVWRTTRLGGFPSLERASVLWAGVEDEAGCLSRLAARVEAAVIGLGFAAERRPFHGHVTLGRLRESRPLRDVVLPLAEQMFGESRLDTITLFESETKPTGSVYREVHKFRLESARNAADPSPERQTAPLQLGATERSHEPDTLDTDDGWPRGQGPNHDP